MTGKNWLPCIQTMCYWFVELKKHWNITKRNLCSLPMAMEMGRTATDFNCQFSVPVFPQVAHIKRGHRFQMQFIQCNNRLDVASVFVFFWGGTMRTMVQHFYVRQRKVQHYINIVIEYGHFRLKITGISRLTLSQCESSPCLELYCSQLSMFSNS